MNGADIVTCAACHADNRGHRGYCRTCGALLQPVCRGCRFVNDRGDLYCGGCGSQLEEVRAGVSDISRAGAVPAPVPHELGELAELLQPISELPRGTELPSSGIKQEDLDRLFGGSV